MYVYAHIILYMNVQRQNGHLQMMGCPPIFLHITVASLLKKIGTGEQLHPAIPWQISYISPRLIAPYFRLKPTVWAISNCVYCFPAKRVLRRICLMAS